ncbi:Protein of unknown function [Massilia sp. CF038]|nr:Protein of unknown function [Massilia sp. CF038]
MTMPFSVGAVLATVLVFDTALAQSPAVPGQPKTARTGALEAGAKVLQTTTPLHPFDIHLVGFHPMKDRPEMQMEAHHYCHQMNEDFAQCMLFDSSEKNARLNGIEYIISESLFNTLPETERAYWHPHNGEILGGQLVAPGIPAAAEKALMRAKMNSYGKTWHVWHTGHEGGAADQLPLGPAMLAWSFSRDGEAIPSMVEKHDRKLGISTDEKRRQRADLRALAHPQQGVDDLKGQFARPTREIPGVTQKGDGR